MPSDLIALGVIRKPHGVRGEASVEPWTESADRFQHLASVTLVSPEGDETRQMNIESVREHAGRALVKFAEISTPEEIAELRGWTLEIPESEARKPGDGEYFLHDLVGLTLVDEGGKEVGVVDDLIEGGGGILLQVSSGGRRFAVPFAAAICKTIDLEEKKIVVELPAGLDDL